MPRSTTIDFLRGLSILAVVLLHIDIRIPFAKSAFGGLFSRPVLNAIYRNGHYGVKVFFVISGFLITRTLLRKVTIPAFYRMRFARIGPCLLALLAVLSALHLAGFEGFTINPAKATLFRALLAALTFHLNQLEIAVGYLPPNWDVLWSLSVEEAFYLGYPWLIRFVRGAKLGLIGLALAVCGPFFRTVLAANEVAEDYAYLACFDCMAIGCAAAFGAKAWKGRGRVFVSAAGWGMLLLVTVFRGAGEKLKLGATGLDVTVLAIGTGLILISARPDGFGGAAVGWIRSFGRNSYEIYLTHSFVMVLGARAFKMASSANWAPVWHVTLVAASGALGWAVAKVYSEPLNRWLRGSVQSGR